MSRLNGILLALLAALIVFDLATRAERTTREDSSALFGADLAVRTAGLRVSGRVGELPAEVRLERDADGRWRLPELDGLPALDSVVEGELERLGRVRGLDRLGSGDEAKRFGFDGAAVREVELLDAGGVAIARFRQVPAREFTGSYVWVEGGDVYGATQLGALSLDPGFFLDPRLFTFEPGRAVRLVVERDGDTVLDLKRTSEGRWENGAGVEGVGDARPTTQVESLLGTLARLPHRGLAEQPGAGNADWTLRVTLDDDSAETLSIRAVSGAWVAERAEWEQGWRLSLPDSAFRDLLVRLETLGVTR